VDVGCWRLEGWSLDRDLNGSSLCSSSELSSEEKESEVGTF
jgi:hypothetical protein